MCTLKNERKLAQTKKGWKVRTFFFTLLLLILFLWIIPRGIHGDDRLCFFNTWFTPPIINGSVDDDDGWLQSNQYVFDNGTYDPGATVQMVRTSSSIYLSFEIQGDPTFDNEDVIVIAFAPDLSNTATHRRIHIFPVVVNYGNFGDAPNFIHYWEDSFRNGVDWNDRGQDPMPSWLANSSGNIRVTSSIPGSLPTEHYIVEIKIPISSNPDQGIDFPLTGVFHMYFNVIRVDSINGTALGELRWPTTAPLISTDPSTTIANLSTNTPSPSTWGEATLDGSCAGVRVVNLYTNNTPSNKINVNSANNIFKVDLLNTGINPANGVTARFYTTYFGAGTDFEPVPVSNNPTLPTGVIAAQGGTDTRQTDGWDPQTHPMNQNFLTNPHICIRVELDTDINTVPASVNTHIANKYYSANMNFGTASNFEHTAIINAKGYDTPPGMTHQTFDLHETTEKSGSKWGRKFKVARIYHCYRHTKHYIVINGNKYALREPAGSFGYVIKHEGDLKKWELNIDGIDPEKSRGNFHTIDVPVEQLHDLGTRVRAVDLSPFVVNVGLGLAFSNEESYRDLDPRVNFQVGMEYLFNRTLSIEAAYGYNNFGNVPGETSTISQVSLNPRLYFIKLMKGRLRTFVTPGIGLYFLKGRGTEFGYNGGMGLQFAITPQLSLETSFFLNKETSDIGFKFSNFQTRFRYRF